MLAVLEKRFKLAFGLHAFEAEMHKELDHQRSSSDVSSDLIATFVHIEIVVISMLVASRKVFLHHTIVLPEPVVDPVLVFELSMEAIA